MYFRYINNKQQAERKAELEEIAITTAQILDTVPKDNNIIKINDKSPLRGALSVLYVSELKPDSVINVFDVDTEEYRTVNANLLYAHMNNIKPGIVVNGIEYKAEEDNYAWIRQPEKEVTDADRKGQGEISG